MDEGEWREILRIVAKNVLEIMRDVLEACRVKVKIRVCGNNWPRQKKEKEKEITYLQILLIS